MCFAAVIGAPFALLFTGVVAGVDIDDFLLKQALNRLLDLNFVRARTDAKNVLVLFFAQQRDFSVNDAV